MKPTDFYREEFLSEQFDVKTKKMVNRRKWKMYKYSSMKFYNGLLPMKYMNNLNINKPSDIDIQLRQWRFLQKDFQIDSKLTQWINTYNNEFKNFGNIATMGAYSVEDAIKIIEKVFSNYTLVDDGKGGLQRDYNNSAILLSKRMQNNTQLKEYEKILKNLKEVYKLFYNEDGKFISAPQFTWYANLIDIAIQRLEADIANGGATDNIFEGYFSKKDGTKKLVNSIIGLGYGLKSRIVEIESMSFIADKLPSGFKIVDTAKIMAGSFNILGGTGGRISGAQIRQDAIIFDLSKNILCSYTFNGKDKKNRPLIEFLNDCDNASKNFGKISISNTELLNLLNNGAVAAVQAKSGQKQSPFNNINSNIWEGIEMGIPDIHAKTLLYITMWAQIGGHIKANHSYYNALFNYCISRNLTYIIGKKNTILAMRGQIISTIDYFKEQFKQQGRYIKALKKISVNNPDIEIPINLSSRHLF